MRRYPPPLPQVPPLPRSSEKDVSPSLPPASESPAESRISRLFSLRRSVGPSMSPSLEQPMPRVAEEEEAAREESLALPPFPCLLPSPLLLTGQQTKRRHILGSLVHSENNYLAALQRLVHDYRRPLETSSPPILSQAKVDTLFHSLAGILEVHLGLRRALGEAVGVWDQVGTRRLLVRNMQITSQHILQL